MSTMLPTYYDVFCEVDDPEADIVLIHGWGMNSLIWDRLMPSLLRNFRVTVVDLPGMGRSPVASRPYELSYLAEQVLSVVPKQAIWIGWSLGGLLAMHIANQSLLDRQEGDSINVQGLMTFASSPKFIADAHWPGIDTKAFINFSQWVDEDWQGSLIRFLALQCKGSCTHKEDVRFLKERLFHHGIPARQALKGGLNILIESDFRESLSALTLPIKMVFGQNDEIIPQQVAAQCQELNSSIEVSTIHGASHIPMLSHVSECAEMIRRFSRKIVQQQ